MAKKILVVDDDRNIVELLRVNLKSAGFDVVVAADALQAINLAHQQTPDLIILDIMLPAGGGKSVLQRLRLSTSTTDIPVLAISALPRDSAMERIKGNPIDGFFNKPIAMEELIEAINKLLSPH
jgi:DNA-binding response OmpR family regulator